MILSLLVASGTDIGLLVRDTLAEAYLQVTVFVAATLIAIYALEQRFAFDLNTRMAEAGRGQVPIAACLGLLPGCGGAIIVVTQFVNGRIGFGALVAVLIATMGDAAFLLIAASPQTAGVVLGVSWLCAVAFGWAIDRLHGRDYLRPRPVASQAQGSCVVGPGRFGLTIDRAWLGLLAAGVPLAVAIAFQQEPNAWFGGFAVYEPVTWFGCGAAIAATALWASRIDEPRTRGVVRPPAAGRTDPVSVASGPLAWARQSRFDTTFVTVWVIAAFLLFELGIVATGIAPEAWFVAAAPVMPLVGVLVGFIPGCGPQILLTTLYLSGVVPLSGLLANAIANDGDALFPAIALAPKAAVMATLYSAIPALLVGYGAFALGY
ncbi:putative manganese transporter [Salinisphaera sp. S4-8]|uniref:putative manganese transporter n=1 Tax=Salinisphaera sp. S4-8 TaxID=633357 RepID=UPI00333EA945